jgi:protein TonB
MEEAVLDALLASRYSPVTVQGKPVETDYTFNIKFSLPDYLRKEKKPKE